MNIIIILGKRDLDTTKKRVDAALTYSSTIPKNEWNDDKKIFRQMLLLSGGKGAETNIYDACGAQMMLDYALLKGVDPDSILLEEKSCNTISNLINSRNVIESYYPKTYDFRGQIGITICTSSYHIKRAFVLASIIFKDYPKLNYTHTNEKITKDEYERESMLLDESLKFIN